MIQRYYCKRCKKVIEREDCGMLKFESTGEYKKTIVSICTAIKPEKEVRIIRLKP